MSNNGQGRRSRRIGAVAVTLALALVAAACGSGDGDGGGTTEAAASPIAEFLGQGDFFSDPEAAQAEFAEQERERQDIIASCMQREGFEYTPVDYSQFDTFSDDLEEWGTEEWIAEWGFGISTQRFSQEQVGPNLKGWDDSQFAESEDGFVDPNQDYVEALSPAEQEAYYEALYGGDDAFPEFDESLTEEEMEAQFEDFTFEPQGCEGEAYTADEATKFYLDFEDEIRDMEERIQADPRIEERTQEIASCVRDKGLEYTDMDTLWERWEDDLQAMDPWANGFEPDFGVTEDEMAQMSEEELDELFSQPLDMPELSEEDKARLGEIQAEEIALAVAVDECGGGFEQEWELQADIRAEYEQEFLDTYADRLEPYRAG